MTDRMSNVNNDERDSRPVLSSVQRSISQLSAISRASDWARDAASEISRISRDGAEWRPMDRSHESVDDNPEENLLQEHGVMNTAASAPDITKTHIFVKHAGNLQDKRDHRLVRKHDWLPVTLRLPYLIMLTLLSLALGVTVVFLTQYSRSNSGLSDDNGSAGIFISWRFMPTLAAVIYTVLVTTLLQDVRRTEVFARLSKHSSVSASASLCWPLRSWWNDPVDAMTKSRNNGARSWALFLAAIANILGFLVISPLSAAFLTPEYIEIVTDIPFQRYDTSAGLAIRTDSSDEIMFRTISASLLNASTSSWITNDYFVLPFAPKAYGSIPVSSTFTVNQLPQKWIAPTTVFRTQVDCSPLKLDGISNTTAFDVGVLQNVTGAYNSTPINWNMTGIHLSTSDGCSVNLYEMSPEGTSNNLDMGGGWWARSLAALSATVPPNDISVNTVSNGTGSCGNRSFLFYNTPWTFNQSLEIGGGLCTTTYLQADISATVTMTDTGSVVTFDSSEFQQRQIPMDPEKFNIGLVEESFFSSNWSMKLKVASSANDLPWFNGPLQPIAASSVYNYSTTQMLEGSALLIDRAQSFQQQWLGQILLAALDDSMADSIDHPTSAQMIVTKRRIVAVQGIGLTLGVLLLLSSMCIIGISFVTRLQRRPLHLSYEPANIAVSTALIANDSETQNLFDGLERATPHTIEKQLSLYRFHLQEGKLVATISPTPIKDDILTYVSNGKTQNQRPVVLRIWMGPLLVISLFALIAALITLYEVSINRGLSQSALTYELDFSIVDTVSRIAPYSIVPTLIAVGFKLWYAAVEETLKRQQPFYSMFRAPTPVTRSILTEYVNAPLFVTSIKAVANSHWMLALVGIGALGTEVFTVGMSALWDKEVVPRAHSVNISQQLELRVVPSLYTTPSEGAGVHQDPTKPVVMESVYGAYLTSWLYTATTEMSQGASSPAWSKDIWSFVPTDLTASRDAILSAASTSNFSTGMNVTIDTPALRARLECQPVDYITNTSLWLSEWNFNNKTIDPETNKTMWNSTNRPPGIDFGYELHPDILIPGQQYDSIPMGGSLGTLVCCSNVTNNVPGDAAIGYWSQATNSTYIKWVVGTPLESLYDDSYRDPTQGSDVMIHRHWIWTDQPQLQAIECNPVIEQANATVVVDLATGTVRNYTINDTPRNATGAWSDDYLTRNRATAEYGLFNFTVSYGYIFWDALLTASNVANNGYEFQFSDQVQDETDRAFNFRFRGLNADLMSYSMLSLVDNDKFALLDANTLIEKASYAFGVFFKHYASNNVTFDQGGLAYQPIGARLSTNLSESIEPGTGYVNSDAVDLPTTKQVFVHVPIEMLIMSPAAVFLCLGVLAFLVITVIIIYAVYSSRLKALPRDVDSLASVLALVYGSRSLLNWAGERQERNDWAYKNVRKGLYAKMGPFQDQAGVQKWGVELEKSVAGADLPLLRLHRRSGSSI